MLVLRASLAARYLGLNKADGGFEINHEVLKQLVILILFETKDKLLTAEVRSVPLNRIFVSYYHIIFFYNTGLNEVYAVLESLL